MSGGSALYGARLVVTGAGGFVGSALTRALAQIPCHLTRLSRQPLPPLPDAACSIADVRADLRYEDIPPAVVERADIIFHLAAQTGAVEADAAPADDYAINVRPLVALVHQCCARGLRPGIVLAGTETQFGTPQRLPVDESHPDAPETAYDLHKCQAERYLKHFSRTRQLRGIGLRLPTVFGPGPPARSPRRGVINQMICRAVAREPLTVWGTGEFRRDYLYVEDAAQAFIAAAAAADRLQGGHFVVSPGEAHTVADTFRAIAAAVEKRTGRHVDVINIRPPEGEPGVTFRDFVGDGRRFREITGWEPAVGFERGIDLTIESALQRRA